MQAEELEQEECQDVGPVYTGPLPVEQLEVCRGFSRA